MSAGPRPAHRGGQPAARQPARPITVIETDVLFALIRDAAVTSRNEAASLSVLLERGQAARRLWDRALSASPSPLLRLARLCCFVL